MINDNKQFYYLPVEGNDVNLIREALLKFLNSGYDSGWFAVHVPENLKNLSSRKEFSSIGQLVTNTKTKIDSFIVYRILEYSFVEDKRQYYEIPIDGRNLPLLAIHTGQDYLSKLDNIPNIPLMRVVPFIGSEIEDWIIKRGAKNLMEEKDDIPIKELEKEIKEILRNNFKNIDFQQTVWEQYVVSVSEQTFNDLYDMKIDYDPRAIKKFLIEDLKWNELAADQAYRIAERIRSGKRSRFRS